MSVRWLALRTVLVGACLLMATALQQCKIQELEERVEAACHKRAS